MSYLYTAVIEDYKLRLFTFWAKSDQDLNIQIAAWCRSRWPDGWDSPPNDPGACLEVYFERMAGPPFCDANKTQRLLPLDPIDLNLINSPLIECWDCTAGVFSPANSNTSFADIVCPRCRGLGRCPEAMWDWLKKGTELREKRQRLDMTLREYAAQRNVKAAHLSDAERGRIDPTRLLNKHEIRP